MNRSENMEPGMAALQDTLDAMAKETPPVPEAFRSAWRKAIRQEAAPQKERGPIPLETVQPEASRSEKDRGKAGPNPARRKGHFSWRRGMSIAAAFVFLLGGALIGWDAVSLVRREAGAPAVLSSTEDAGMALVEFSANEAAGMAMKAEPDSAMGEAVEAGSDEILDEAVEAVANDALMMAMRPEPSATMKPAGEAVADEVMEEAVTADANTALEEIVEAEEDTALEEATEQDSSAPEARPMRTVGFILAGLAIPLTLGALILRKRERR